MGNNIMNNVAVTTMSSQASILPSSRGIGATESSLGTVKLQALKPIDPMGKADKKDQQNRGLTASDTKKLVDELNEYMNDLQTQLGFSVREDLDHQVVVEIKNRKTEELLKQIPSEELLKIREKMEELTGFLFDQSV
jgi:flagellar protein FlaG